MQRELWESLMPCWGGLLDVQALGNRVKELRKARRKKELQREKEKDAAATPHTPQRSASRREAREQKVEPRAPQSADHSRVEGAGKHTKDKPREPDADRRTAEGRARHEERLKARKEKRRRREALAAAAASLPLRPPPPRPQGSGRSPQEEGEGHLFSQRQGRSEARQCLQGEEGHRLVLFLLLAPIVAASSVDGILQSASRAERWSQRYFPVANPNTVTIGVSGAASTGNPAPWGPSSSAAHNARNKPSSTR